MEVVQVSPNEEHPDGNQGKFLKKNPALPVPVKKTAKATPKPKKNKEEKKKEKPRKKTSRHPFSQF